MSPLFKRLAHGAGACLLMATASLSVDAGERTGIVQMKEQKQGPSMTRIFSPFKKKANQNNSFVRRVSDEQPPAPAGEPAPMTVTPPPMMPASPAAGCGVGTGCGAAPGGWSCPTEGEEAEAWELTNVFTDSCGNNWAKDAGFRFGGSLVQSYTFNFDSPSDRFNGPVTALDRSNEYQMNQLYLFGEWATNTDDKDFDIGGRVDVLYGTSARFTTATGLEDEINHGGSFYTFAMPQAYAEVAYKKLKVKLGHFYSPVGYQVFDSSQNFFATLPYTFQYGEPFTHTGALATYEVSDKLTIGGGIIRGWDAWDGSNPATSPNLGGIGTASYSFNDGSSIAYVGLITNELNQGGTFSDRYLQTLVYSRSLTEKLSYVFQTDFGTQQNALASGETAQWYGINQYLFYTINPCLTMGANYEWFRDDDGFRVGGFLP